LHKVIEIGHERVPKTAAAVKLHAMGNRSSHHDGSEDAPSGVELTWEQRVENALGKKKAGRKFKSKQQRLSIKAEQFAFGDAGAAHVAERLERRAQDGAVLSQLTMIEIENSNVRDEGAVALGTALTRCLAHPEASGDARDDEGAVLPALEMVSLRWNGLTTVGLTSIAVAIAGSHVSVLRLGINQRIDLKQVHGSDEEHETADALTRLCCDGALEELELSNCVKLRDEGATMMAQVLRSRGCTLRRLDLGSTNVGDTGASALAESLSSNTVLEELNLSGNNIGDAGARAFVDVLGSRASPVFLKKLNLRGNEYDEDMVLPLRRAGESAGCAVSADVEHMGNQGEARQDEKQTYTKSAAKE
jgi:Leucine Rich repeat